jgi:hypothetical protein
MQTCRACGREHQSNVLLLLCRGCYFPANNAEPILVQPSRFECVDSESFSVPPLERQDFKARYTEGAAYPVPFGDRSYLANPNAGKKRVSGNATVSEGDEGVEIHGRKALRWKPPQMQKRLASALAYLLLLQRVHDVYNLDLAELRHPPTGTPRKRRNLHKQVLALELARLREYGYRNRALCFAANLAQQRVSELLSRWPKEPGQLYAGKQHPSYAAREEAWRRADPYVPFFGLNYATAPAWWQQDKAWWSTDPTTNLYRRYPAIPDGAPWAGVTGTEALSSDGASAPLSRKSDDGIRLETQELDTDAVRDSFEVPSCDPRRHGGHSESVAFSVPD